MSLYIEQAFDLEILAGKWSSALSFRITEVGGLGTVKTVSLASSGTFMPRTAITSYTKPDPDDAPVSVTITSLLTALQTAINGTLQCTYTVTFSTTTGLITITAAPGGSGVTSFTLDNLSTTAQRLMGFTANRSGALTYAANRSPYFWIKGTQGGISEFFWDEEADPEIGEDLRSHGGEVYGVSQDELPIKFDCVVPLEPKAVLWNDHANTATLPWTWERFFRHGRGRLPILFDLNDGTTAKKFLVQMRAEGMAFRPRARQTKNLWTYGDVPIMAWRLGTVP